MKNVKFHVKPVKPHGRLFLLWLFFLGAALLMAGVSCNKDDKNIIPVLFLKSGTGYTADGAVIPVGGKIIIGLMASGSQSPLTYLRIDRILSTDTITEIDRGIYIGGEGLNEDFTFSKDTAQQETWMISLMNACRETAVHTFTVYKGQGSAYGNINFFPSVAIGHQDHASLPHYLDLDHGVAYDNSSVPGHEADIDLLCYFYVTSGQNSPTLTCPGYTAAVAYYPSVNSWTVKNNTLYDYYSTDNNLISVNQFDAAENDSLLVKAFLSGQVSGNCKFCYTGKVIPFKTQQSKYGLIKVIQADESASGKMELAIKIQQ